MWVVASSVIDIQCLMGEVDGRQASRNGLAAQHNESADEAICNCSCRFTSLSNFEGNTPKGLMTMIGVTVLGCDMKEKCFVV